MSLDFTKMFLQLVWINYFLEALGRYSWNLLKGPAYFLQQVIIPQHLLPFFSSINLDGIVPGWHDPSVHGASHISNLLLIFMFRGTLPVLLYIHWIILPR